MRSINRVLILGIDGGSWSVLRPLIEMGSLRNLAKLIKGGTSAPLQSTIPPHTAAAWTSAFTGVNPGKHGIYDFTKNWREGDRLIFNSSRSIKAPMLWQVLSRLGKTVGVVNVPMTYPVSQIKGIMVAGMLAPSKESSAFVYPASVREMLDDYTLDVEGSLYSSKEPHTLFQIFNHVVDQRAKLIVNLLHRESFDLFAGVFTTPDRVLHRFYKEWEEKDKTIFPFIVQFFDNLDRRIGDIINAGDKFNHVFIISDHGFARLRKKFFLNRYLAEMGLLEFTKNKGWLTHGRLLLHRLGLYERLAKSPLVKSLLHRFPKELMALRILDHIAWDRTQAYLMTRSSRGVSINLKGREPKGWVEKKAYEELRGVLIRLLGDLKDPVSGKRVIEQVNRREEIFSGPALEEAPDLMFLCRDGWGVSEEYFPRVIQDSLTETGWHSQEGIFIGYGDHIRPENQLEKISIMDVTPLALYMLGTPLPTYMDGKVSKEIFNEEYWKDHEVMFEERGLSDREEGLKTERPQGEDEAIAKKLEGLGYL